MTQTENKQARGLLVTLVILLAAILLCLVGFIVVRQGVFEPQPEPVIQVFRTPEEQTQPVEETVPQEEPPAPTADPDVPANPFGVEDFGYEGQYLKCLSADCMLGVDVSKYQGNVDWKAVKAAGFDFVMIRVGARGYGEAGGMFSDTRANSHYRGAKAAGLLVGAYFFSQATSPEEAVAEAEYALRLTRNWELDLPIVFDWELMVGLDARTDDVDGITLTYSTIAFCETIRKAGKEPMVYVSPWIGLHYLEELKPYRQWLALYKDQMTYKYRFDMWQYTCTGSVPGIPGDVDVNIYIPMDLPKTEE